MTIEDIAQEVLGPFAGRVIDHDLMVDAAQALADETGYECNCKYSGGRLHFEVRSEPPILLAF